MSLAEQNLFFLDTDHVLNFSEFRLSLLQKSQYSSIEVQGSENDDGS